MGKYLHLFKTKTEHDSVRKNDYHEPWVSIYPEEREYMKIQDMDDVRMYFMGEYTCESVGEGEGSQKTGYIWDYDSGEDYHNCALSEGRNPQPDDMVYAAYRVYDQETGG